MRIELKDAVAKEVEALHGAVKTIPARGELGHNAEALEEWRQAMAGLAPEDKSQFLPRVNAKLESNRGCLDPHIYGVDLSKNEFILKYDFMGEGQSLYSAFDRDGKMTFFAKQRNDVFDVTSLKTDSTLMHCRPIVGKTIAEILKAR